MRRLTKRELAIKLLKREKLYLQARTDFNAFRESVTPNIVQGWFQYDIGKRLQQFYESFASGERPRLLISTPPQHGKSIMIVDFIAWVAGRNPHYRCIFASFSDRLGVRANLRLQRIYDSQAYRMIFPDTCLAQKGEAIRTRELLEYAGKDGYFRNTTCGGAITGESQDIGIIDDPVKGREEANSETMRAKLWDWFTDDFSTRFSEHSALLMIMTRWHIDDIAGRLIATDKSFQVATYPAIAEQDDDKRKAGEALFPQLKSLDFLLAQKRLMTSASWEALYQQRPVIADGDMIKVENIKVVDSVPSAIKETVRYWDKAGTEGGGANTAGVLMHRLANGTFCIADVVRGQWSAGRREEVIKQTAALDGDKVHIWIEQEPGSGGKESAENTVKNLAGYTIKVERVTGSKEVRAEPFAAQVEAGNVSILRAQWTKDFIEEARLFPNGKYKDQIDAAGGAFNKLTLESKTTGLLDYYAAMASEASKEKEKKI